MGMAQHLYPGCDVWLNNPLRPLEACGTSGMKAALNGCLNLSVLDGWWDEWFDGNNGWAIPTADGVERRRTVATTLEAAALYDLIETRSRRASTTRPRRAAAPLDRDGQAHPGHLGPKVLAGRMVREYVERALRAAAAAQRRLAAPDPSGSPYPVPGRWPSGRTGCGRPGRRSGWTTSRRAARRGHPELGSTLTLRVQVTLGEPRPGRRGRPGAVRQGRRRRPDRRPRRSPSSRPPGPTYGRWTLRRPA